MSGDKLWVRCGDADDYHDFDSLSEAAEYLALCGVSGPINYHDRYGVWSQQYSGQNYISLFWGTDDANPSRGLTDSERAEIESLL